MVKQELTYELAHELIDVDFELGVITWRHRNKKWFNSIGSYKSFNNRFCGKRAGCILTTTKGKNYYIVRIFYQKYLVHRVIFLMKYGYWPNEIDHINGNGMDNNINNIRDVSRVENMRNQRLHKTNSTGITGVCWDKQKEKWRAYIIIKGKFKHLCRSNDFFEACRARISAEKKYGFHENHGEKRPL